MRRRPRTSSARRGPPAKAGRRRGPLPAHASSWSSSALAVLLDGRVAIHVPPVDICNELQLRRLLAFARGGCTGQVAARTGQFSHRAAQPPTWAISPRLRWPLGRRGSSSTGSASAWHAPACTKGSPAAPGARPALARPATLSSIPVALGWVERTHVAGQRAHLAEVARKMSTSPGWLGVAIAVLGHRGQAVDVDHVQAARALARLPRPGGGARRVARRVVGGDGGAAERHGLAVGHRPNAAGDGWERVGRPGAELRVLGHRMAQGQRLRRRRAGQHRGPRVPLHRAHAAEVVVVRVRGEDVPRMSVVRRPRVVMLASMSGALCGRATSMSTRPSLVAMSTLDSPCVPTK